MMEYTDVRNIRWCDANHTAIICEVNFTALPEDYVEFTATANDIEEHGQEIFRRGIVGDFGLISPPL